MSGRIVFGVGRQEAPLENAESNDNRTKKNDALASTVNDVHKQIGINIRKAQSFHDFARAVSAAHVADVTNIQKLEEQYSFTDAADFIEELSLPPFEILPDEEKIYQGMRSGTKAPDPGKIVIGIQRIGVKDDYNFRVIGRSHSANSRFRNVKYDMVGLGPDIDTTSRIHGEEVMYLKPSSVCLKRACEGLIGDNPIIEIEVDYSNEEDVFTRLNKEGAIVDGTLNYRTHLHNPTDYILFALHGAFENETPLEMGLYDQNLTQES